MKFDLQLFATSTVQNYVRNAVSASRVGTVDLTVTNPQATLSTSSPQFSSGLGVIYAGDMVYLTANNALASLSSADPTVSTTSSTAVTAVNAAGTAVTPVTMNNIFVGAQLVVDTGTQQEQVAVTAVTGTTFTATFTKTHAAGFAISDRKVSLQSTTSLPAATSTAITVGASAANFTVNEWVLVDAAGTAQIAQVTAKAATTITIQVPTAVSQPFQVDTLPVNTTGGITNVGSQTITVASMANIAVGSSLLIDTVVSGVQETVIVTAVTSTTLTANFQNAHTTGFAVANAKANSNTAKFLGVAVDTYPIVFTQGVSGPFPSGSPQKIQYRRDGEWRFHTTAGDTLTIGMKVYLGADGQTVQATALGTSIGVVAADQRPVGVQLGNAVSGAAGQDVIIALTPAIGG